MSGRVKAVTQTTEQALSIELEYQASLVIESIFNSQSEPSQIA
jgi:hypothetical protein